MISLAVNNEEAKGWFRAWRGLRQYNPYALSFFALVEDIINKFALRAADMDFMEVFEVDTDSLPSSVYIINLLM